MNANLIQREIKESVKNKLFRNKAIIIYGPRQVGKTTLVEMILSELNLKNSELKNSQITNLNGDDSDIRELLEKPNIVKLKKDRKSTRLNSSHTDISRMPSSA